ncbi:DEAD/DEAH box helicase [Undibacterium sp.]|uniref:DEAD/DEAH box helicase n=1 Tax=Undibacterium sp. TaxID=1914977 RepID=UPI003752E93D
MKLRQWQAECISRATQKFDTEDNHFLCLATPGAGKTLMASALATVLLRENKIDLILCFSPSVVVAEDFGRSLAAHTNMRMDGLLGSRGRSLTYQAMLHLDSSFWSLFDSHRIFVIFDEIHHCASDGVATANSWGQKIIENIQGRAAYTLALTGTPWRSDQIPIALARYSHTGKIHCDYTYGLSQAISDNVCRIPKITLIDNDRIIVRRDNETSRYTSFEHLLKDSGCSYQQLVEDEELIVYFLEQSSKKLDAIRKEFPNAGGLIVAASVGHANEIARIMKDRLGENAHVATYREEDPLTIISTFKDNSEKWIISVGMISEGTNIPRLRVCCHLTRVKTELHFRQVLGRILRSENEINSEAFLYIPAEPMLIEYATRVADEVPNSVSLRFDSMSNAKFDSQKSNIPKDVDHVSNEISLNLGLFPTDYLELPKQMQTGEVQSSLANAYESSMNIFGRFRQELVSLDLGFR